MLCNRIHNLIRLTDELLYRCTMYMLRGFLWFQVCQSSKNGIEAVLSRCEARIVKLNGEELIVIFEG